MITFSTETTVGALVCAVPARVQIFEKLRIDYCCGGKKPLGEACRERGLDPVTVMTMLEAVAGNEAEASAADVAGMTLTELCDHIVQTHHQYLRDELPRLDFLTRKVAAVHGETEPRLVEIRKVFQDFAREIRHHALEEEQVAFPQLRALESSDRPDATSEELEGIFAQLESEHDEAGEALVKFRTLTDDFSPPEWACNTFRVLYASLAALERDMHQHVHKENNVLFPRALAAFAA